MLLFQRTAPRTWMLLFQRTALRAWMLLFLYFCKPGKPGETGKPGVLLHFSVTCSSRVVIPFRKNSFGQLQFRFLLQFYLSFFHPVVHSFYQVVKRDNIRRIFTTFFLLSSSLRSNSHSNSFFHPARIHFLLQFHFTLSKNVVKPQKKCPSHSKARQRRHCRGRKAATGSAALGKLGIALGLVEGTKIARPHAHKPQAVLRKVHPPYGVI